MSDPKTLQDFPATLDDTADAETESSLVGVTTRGAPIYHDTGRGRLVPMSEEDDGFVPDFESSWDIAPDETVQDVVDEIEETVGWESLVGDEKENEN